MYVFNVTEGCNSGAEKGVEGIDEFIGLHGKIYFPHLVLIRVNELLILSFIFTTIFTCFIVM